MANTFNLGNGRNVFTNISVTPPLVDGDIVDGQNGDDVIDVTGNDLTLSGSNGDDQIIATGNDNKISGGRGRDELTATGRRNFLDGGQGEDILSSNSSTSNFFDYGHLEIYEICQPLITIKKCLSASSQQIISAQAMQYCRQIDSYWIL
ncbi:hypothetical protein KBY83_11180, partial [Cyanobium sp. WKJ7-Wakatipu]|uniref:hypothetical protein n=1 Tax=Cyanobium sp. WKJ7-Wakatipu TaxID=2823726 RepID=UPI0037C156D5|nr:hypothetical protein [Cyanobium sp. WKJ7-Wakatipu]